MGDSTTTIPRSDGKYHCPIEVSDETAQKIVWLSAAHSLEWGPLVEYLVNLEAARMGYKPPVINNAEVSLHGEKRTRNASPR